MLNLSVFFPISSIILPSH